MKISVVIPIYNEEKYIAKCLESITKQKRKADEIIVVNNNSTDRSVEIAQKYKVKIVTEKKQGMIPARNKGFNTAKYDIIVRTDADTVVPKNWLSRIEKHFQDPETIGVSGPVHFYNIPESTHVSNWLTYAFFKPFKQVCKHDCLIGPNMSIRKSAWNKVKNSVCLSDKEVHEDVDLALHLGIYGKIIFDPKLILTSSPRRLKKYDTYFEYPYRYIRTLQQHRSSILALEKSKSLMKRVIPKTKRIIRTLTNPPLN